MSTTTYELRGAVAVITMNNPPVNGLGFDLRRDIVEGLTRAEADANVKAVVLIGSARAFSGGADIREFGSSMASAESNLNTVIRVLESAKKPVVAAIGGVCMGGGLELALGCHYCVAVKGAQIALPEVKLGLMPGAGGTQRLPRLIGAEAALNMIVSGNSVSSEQLKDSALFDELFERDLLPGAIAFARMRLGPNCTARDLVSAITPPLLAVYASCGTVQPTSATNEATLMIQPPPARMSSGMPCLQQR